MDEGASPARRAWARACSGRPACECGCACTPLPPRAGARTRALARPSRARRSGGPNPGRGRGRASAATRRRQSPDFDPRARSACPPPAPPAPAPREGEGLRVGRNPRSSAPGRAPRAHQADCERRVLHAEARRDPDSPGCTASTAGTSATVYGGLHGLQRILPLTKLGAVSKTQFTRRTSVSPLLSGLGLVGVKWIREATLWPACCVVAVVHRGELSGGGQSPGPGSTCSGSLPPPAHSGPTSGLPFGILGCKQHKATLSTLSKGSISWLNLRLTEWRRRLSGAEGATGTWESGPAFSGLHCGP
ncbi:uncharacterized protein LOC141573542 [Camelus bactrianus]|uniref:Uncharacterized protein LOC141573542 n=1 Tax=Camelus bactrianus TaxID=9837 RepID=A0AC58NJR9_CAMBA